MIFRFDYRETPHNQVIVTIRYNNYVKVLQQLGDHHFYKFLTDVFNDISKESREGPISFTKYGDSDLRINWDTITGMDHLDVFHSISEGVNTLYKRKDYYFKRYNYILLLHINEERMNEFASGFFLKGKILGNWFDIDEEEKEEDQSVLVNVKAV